MFANEDVSRQKPQVRRHGRSENMHTCAKISYVAGDKNGKKWKIMRKVAFSICITVLKERKRVARYWNVCRKCMACWLPRLWLAHGLAYTSTCFTLFLWTILAWCCFPRKQHVVCSWAASRTLSASQHFFFMILNACQPETEQCKLIWVHLSLIYFDGTLQTHDEHLKESWRQNANLVHYKEGFVLITMVLTL